MFRTSSNAACLNISYEVEISYTRRPYLVLIRGIAGSGKTTMARLFSFSAEEPFEHYEADMFEGLYYEDATGINFDGSKIKLAHEWCRESTEAALMKNENVIVSNTFTQKWEIQPYLDLAKKYDCLLEVIVAKGEFKSVHNVPAEVIQKMKDRWEDLA